MDWMEILNILFCQWNANLDYCYSYLRSLVRSVHVLFLAFVGGGPTQLGRGDQASNVERDRERTGQHIIWSGIGRVFQRLIAGVP
jgi:hypothetical protein